MPSPRPNATRSDNALPKPRSKTRIFIARGETIRAVNVSPATALVMAVLFSATLATGLGSGAYLLMKSEWRPGLAATADAMRDDYEDRLATLRRELDRVKSKSLIEQATVATKVDRLMQRQDDLLSRQAMIGRLAEAARKAGLDIKLPDAGQEAEAAPSVAPAHPDLHSELDGASPNRLDGIEGKLAGLSDTQESFVEGMTKSVAGRATRLSQLLGRLGRSVPHPADEDVGGPFVPLPSGSGDQNFQANIGALSDALDRLGAARTIAQSMPLGSPLPGAPITSGFGPRIDPFLGRPALHTGIDYLGSEGSPARSIAAGTVVAAGYDGGYGNMVDVDHGHGLVTRYGHLSVIGVRIGQKIAASGIVGRIGSTGRATGPHLHYEIRVNGEPVDPLPYVKTGTEIAALR